MNTIMNFIESLNTLVVEGSYISEDGLIKKSVHVTKDRSLLGILNKRFYACEISDLYKLAKAWDAGDFHFPVNDSHMANLWLYGDLVEYDNCEYKRLRFSKITQVPHIQIYERVIAAENFPSANPYDSNPDTWCTKDGISLLVGDVVECAKHALLFCPDYGVTIPLKMGATINAYDMVLVNLSELAEKKELIKEALKKNPMLIIVQDINELRDLIPSFDMEYPMITDRTETPQSIHVPYDTKCRQVLSSGDLYNLIKAKS